MRSRTSFPLPPITDSRIPAKVIEPEKPYKYAAPKEEKC